MMDEDREKLCADLRDPPWNITAEEFAEIAALAADKIERLAQERDIWVRDGEIAWRKVLELSRCITTPQSQR